MILDGYSLAFATSRSYNHSAFLLTAMLKRSFTVLLVSLAGFLAGYAQVPLNTQIQILKAEDARRYDSMLEGLLKSPDAVVRKRAALAAGRIGSDLAIELLTKLLRNDGSDDVQTMAAFALGEIESIKAADPILAEITEDLHPAARPPQSSSAHLVTPGRLARLVEAAGKIAAANPKNEKAKPLGDAILAVLNAELADKNTPDTLTIRLALTAALRTRPTGAEEVVRKFLGFTDPNIVGDALNTLARLRAKNSNRDCRDLLQTSVYPVVRANAARVLGAADDKDAVDVLIKAATNDSDSRVRVSAIRSLGALKDAKAADKLIDRGEKLAVDHKRSKFTHPVEENELIEIASTLGRIVPNSDDPRAVALLMELDKASVYSTPEVKIALAQISPKGFFQAEDAFNHDYKVTRFPFDWHITSALVQGLGELAKLDARNAQGQFRERAAAEVATTLAAYYRINQLTLADMQKPDVRNFLKDQKGIVFDPDGRRNKDVYLPVSDILTAYAAFKPEGLDEMLRNFLKLDDPLIRATAAGLVADQPYSSENADSLNDAFDYAWKNDLQYNDAILATLDALYKLDKQGSRGSVSAFILAAAAPDQLVRAKALTILKDDAYKNKQALQEWLRSDASKDISVVKPYAGVGTKVGQILNKDADYRRALSRKNGSVKAIITTEKCTFAIDLLPEDAPLTVDNFIKLANAKYFNGVEVHRVVPNFVVQDGDPRGDGNGGPGWSIRCEINMVPYERGAVGMALSGKDTGGSQWFVTHSPQPHLDGGYTVFGRVNETDMKVVDGIVRGDKILSVKVMENIPPRRTRGKK